MSYMGVTSVSYMGVTSVSYMLRVCFVATERVDKTRHHHTSTRDAQVSTGRSSSVPVRILIAFGSDSLSACCFQGFALTLILVHQRDATRSIVRTQQTGEVQRQAPNPGPSWATKKFPHSQSGLYLDLDLRPNITVQSMCQGVKKLICELLQVFSFFCKKFC